MNKKYFGLIALSVSLISYVDTIFADGWYNDFKISQLQYSRGVDGVHVVYSGGTGNPNPDACDNSDRFIAPLRGLKLPYGKH